MHAKKCFLVCPPLENIAIENKQCFLVCPFLVNGNTVSSFIYTFNEKKFFLAYVRDGELLLVDSGCEYSGYSSDTTRVWPVNGRFTKAQRELYEVMLNIQKNCIKVEKLPSLLNKTE